MSAPLISTMNKYTATQIKQLRDLLAAQLRAGLLSDEDYYKRRREILDMSHERVSDESVVSKPAEKIRGIRI